MSSKKRAATGHSAVNLVALQNLRVIRRRINDKAWKAAAERRMRKEGKTIPKKTHATTSAEPISGSAYEQTLMFAVHKLVKEYAEKGKIPRGWDPQSGMALPEFPNTRKRFAAATGIDEGHLRALDDGIVEFTLEDAIQIARVGNMDLATFLTPSIDDLESNEFFDLNPSSNRKESLRMYEWLLWLRGYRPLPEQVEEEFIQQSASPAPRMDKLDNVKSFRGHDVVEEERNRIRSSQFYVDDYGRDETNTNPFGAPLTPYEKSPLAVNSPEKSHVLIIQNTLLLATQMKRIMSTSNKGALKLKRNRFVTLIEFIRYSTSGIVRLLIRLGK